MAIASPRHLKLVPWAVAVLLGSGLSTARAGFIDYPTANGTIRLGAEYAFEMSPSTPLDGMSPSGPATIYTTPNGADMYLYESSGGSNVFFHTYGFTGASTYFGARASGEGSFYASTLSRFTQSYTNSTAVAQIFNFDFTVDFGELGISGAGAGFAELMLSIRKTVNGTTSVVSQNLTRLQQTATPADLQCTDAGTGALDAYMDCNGSSNVWGNGGLYSVSLGEVAAGDSFTLDYDIIATVAGDLSGSNGYGYGFEFVACGNQPEVEAQLVGALNEAVAEIGECMAPSIFPGSAIARSGDPFNGPQFGTGGPSTDNVGAFSVTSTAAEVPEPGTLALVGVAASALALTRRRRSRRGD